MIGSLRGKLTFKKAPAIIIECSGVGYDVETPMSTFFELPAVGEELFFRGALLSGLRIRVHAPAAVVISSVCFGALHGGLVGFAAATLFGAFLALTTLATGRLWWAIAAHLIHNALLVVVSIP